MLNFFTAVLFIIIMLFVNSSFAIDHRLLLLEGSTLDQVELLLWKDGPFDNQKTEKSIVTDDINRYQDIIKYPEELLVPLIDQINHI